MENQAYKHVVGPVYFCSFDEDIETDSVDSYDKEWVIEVFNALDAACEQLPQFVQDNGDVVDVRFKQGQQWFSIYDLLANEKVQLIAGEYKSCLRHFVKACIKASKIIDYALWIDNESNLGQLEATWLACQSKQDVPLFIAFLECCDLDHEVDHGGDIADVFETYGWCNETMALWVARVGNCCGQWGHDGWDSEPYLYEWVMQDKKREALLIKLVAGNLIAISRWEWILENPTIDRINENKDYFSTPEHGLGEIAERIADKAVELAQSTIKEHLKNKTTPKHWLYPLIN